jgi:hypothetical protein
MVPTERIISLGFEYVVAPSRIAELRRRLEEVRATGVTLSLDRPDWTEFPWPERPEAGSKSVRESGRDFVAEGIAASALTAPAEGGPSPSWSTPCSPGAGLESGTRRGGSLPTTPTP